MVSRSGRDGINACVSFQGGVIQSCVLMLDPVCARIEGRLEITFCSRHVEAGATGTGFAAVDNFGDELRPLIDDCADIGELVAEHLALVGPLSAEAWGKAHRRGSCADHVALRWTRRCVGGPDKTGELKVSHGGTETKSLEVKARYASRASSAASRRLRGMLQLW